MIVMAMQHPLNDSNGSLESYLNLADIITTSIFAFEMIIKIISYGFLFNGDRSYLRDVWNMLDCVAVIFTIITLTPIGGSI
jgi:voltage-dependent calcium channel L type alpha-1D